MSMPATKLIKGKQTTRDQAVIENLNLVRKVAQKYLPRATKAGIEFEELVNVGSIGLLKAFDAFDESKGFTFSTYAVPQIIGAITFELRNQAEGDLRYSGQIKENAGKIVKAELENETPKDIAAELEITIKQAKMALEYINRKEPIRLDGKLEGRKQEEGHSFHELIGFSQDNSLIFVNDFLDQLPEKEREIVELLLQGYNNTEIGKKLGFSRGYVKLHLPKIRKKLERYLSDKKGAGNMAKLALEEYQDLKAKGMADKDIAAKKNMNPQYISQLKKKWFNNEVKPNLKIVEPVKTTIKPVESKPIQQDKTAEYADLINELSDKVKQQEGMIEKLQAKVTELENVNAACGDVEEETANLRKEVEYLNDKRLEEMEAYLKTLDQLKDSDYQLENHKNWLKVAGEEINVVKKENQHLWGLLKLKAAELNV